MKTWEDMSIEELEQEKSRLENETYEHQWQYEFTKQEIKEIDRLISQKKKDEKPKIFITEEHGGITVYSNKKDIEFYYIDNDTEKYNSNEEQEEQEEAKKEFEKLKSNLHILYADF